MSSIILEDFYRMEDLKYLYFVTFLMLYMLVLFANAIVIFVIIINQVLHSPMNYFLCNLAVNGIYGGTALLPHLLGTLMSPLMRYLWQAVRLKPTSCTHMLS